MTLARAVGSNKLLNEFADLLYRISGIGAAEAREAMASPLFVRSPNQAKFLGYVTQYPGMLCIIIAFNGPSIPKLTVCYYVHSVNTPYSGHKSNTSHMFQGTNTYIFTSIQ